jgi:hypothetical protein
VVETANLAINELEAATAASEHTNPYFDIDPRLWPETCSGTKHGGSQLQIYSEQDHLAHNPPIERGSPAFSSFSSSPSLLDSAFIPQKGRSQPIINHDAPQQLQQQQSPELVAEAQEELPFLVNAKQLNRIRKRRIARRLDVLLSRATHFTTYISEAHHKHAVRRPRGADGRYLSTNEVARAKGTRSTPPVRKKKFSRRTKTGCMTCRKRKRKCDETHPTCRLCKHLGLDCVKPPRKEKRLYAVCHSLDHRSSIGKDPHCGKDRFESTLMPF